jgi:hypothetical protein
MNPGAAEYAAMLPSTLSERCNSFDTNLVPQLGLGRSQEI